MGLVAGNLRAVLAGIEAAAVRAGRDPRAVRLAVVTKTVPVEMVREALEAGAAILAENRVQEALLKQKSLAWDGPMPEWHLIGTLQKNKARHAVGAFTLIHSLDGLPLAGEINRQAAKRGIVQEALIEVNVAGEASKHGVSPEDALPLAKDAASMPNIKVVGLMCVPPFTDDPESSRPHFVMLRELLGEINKAGLPMHELSMGMTQDYVVAVEEGATIVRVGTAIFGART